ncbi:hypothetical protein SARC_01709 [Sphaeroforma arctica JP610]|uniref:Nucleotide-diphospho-sugar transferase domain-containing protein n=1 Tax=Sphaeroforma arctica JP610 TaxID=667725 RepID=A0A0L0GAX8_9EUKA|nr:hypothetical protein SARC_01709 [Sphaeroforma arctica JP610]KNC86140.1 hypothetical protein SARC_01709 [Sphaeroforma arctica JP610]|eukprot:XP_014160042.1 hypothetical protein SARC_01709 [Sphaeroforma arctica JP610]
MYTQLNHRAVAAGKTAKQWARRIPRVLYKAAACVAICCILVFSQFSTNITSYPTHFVAPRSPTKANISPPKRALAMTCPSRETAEHHPLLGRWIHNAADPFLGVSAVADELVSMRFPYPMYVLAFKNERDATRRCHEVVNSVSASGLVVKCIELPQNVPTGYGYAKIDAMMHLTTETDIDEVIFLDCDSLPVANMTNVFAMLSSGGSWRGELPQQLSPSVGHSVDHVAAVFWGDIEGHYDPSIKIIEQKYSALHNIDMARRHAAVEKSKYYDSYHMRMGCDTGIMLVNLRRSQAALELLVELKDNTVFQDVSYGDKDLWRLAYHLTDTPFRLSPYVGALGSFDSNKQFLFASQAKHNDNGDIISVHQLWFPSRHEPYFQAIAANADEALESTLGADVWYVPAEPRIALSPKEKKTRFRNCLIRMKDFIGISWIPTRQSIWGHASTCASLWQKGQTTCPCTWTGCGKNGLWNSA